MFNEKPSKEEVMAATQAEGPKRVSDSAIIHTSMGDIHVKLFPVEYVFGFMYVFGNFSIISFFSSFCVFWWQYSTLIFQARSNYFLPLFLLSLFPPS